MRIILSLFLIFLMGLTDLVWTQNKRPIAAIKEVIGVVKIKRSESRQKVVASIGNLLYNSDEVTTSKGASAALLFIDGSLLKIQENSEVTITAQRKGEKELNTKVDMPLGEIWAKVTRRDTKFEVETPSSVASVKGTEFSLAVDETGSSILMVYEGLVEFQNELGRVMVKRNQKSIAQRNQAPETPQNISKKELKEKLEKAPQWDLEIKAPSGKQTPNQSFQLQIKALDAETNKIDLACNNQVVVSSFTTGAQFSLDGSVWIEELNGQFASGILNLYARGRTDKELMISASAANSRPARIAIPVEKSRRQKRQEGERVQNLMEKIGIENVAGLDYSIGEVKGSSEDINQVLSKIESGDLIVAGKEIIESPDGTKKVILRLQPATTKNADEKTAP